MGATAAPLDVSDEAVGHFEKFNIAAASTRPAPVLDTNTPDSGNFMVHPRVTGASDGLKFVKGLDQ